MRRFHVGIAALALAAAFGIIPFGCRQELQDPPATRSCEEGIGAGTTNALFAALKELPPANGCALSSVDTEHDRIRVRYDHGDTALSALTLTGKSCGSPGDRAGKSFAYRVPDDLKASCPATVEAIAALLSQDDFGGTIVLPRDTDPSPRLARFAASLRSRSAARLSFAALLVVLALFAWRWRARRARR